MSISTTVTRNMIMWFLTLNSIDLFDSVVDNSSTANHTELKLVSKLLELLTSGAILFLAHNNRRVYVLTSGTDVRAPLFASNRSLLSIHMVVLVILYRIADDIIR